MKSLNFNTDKIYLKQWLNQKPYNNPVVTDNYYLKICNKVNDAISKKHLGGILKNLISKDEQKELSIFFVSYFEDLISGTNIWNTFGKINKRIYNTFVPIYSSNDYVEGEINLEDVKFLFWYFLNCNNEGNIIYPEIYFIDAIGKEVMDVLEEAWEFAPENKDLKTCYQIDSNDYYSARNLIDIFFFGTYLFFPDTRKKLIKKLDECVAENKNSEILITLINETRDNVIHEVSTKLLALKGAEWAAEYLGKKHKLYDSFLSISKKVTALFLYKSQNSQFVILEHIATGMKFEITKKSLSPGDFDCPKDSIVIIGLVKWQKEWWFSGHYGNFPFDSKLVEDERKSMKSKNMVEFLYNDTDKIKDILANQLESFLKFNNRKQIVFLKVNQLNGFLKEVNDFYNQSLELNHKEIMESKKKADKLAIDDNGISIDDFSGMDEDAIVFFNPKGGIELVYNINSAFPDEDNILFKEEDFENSFIDLVFDKNLSVELVHYCINNYAEKVSFFKTNRGKSILNNLDFLLRFYKSSIYITTPTISLLR